MRSPEMGIGMPEQKTPEQNERQQNVQIEYVKPGYYNDGTGSLTITHGNGQKITFRLNSQYLDQSTIDRIQGSFNDAKNDDERTIIAKKIKMAIESTAGGQTVVFPMEKE